MNDLFSKNIIVAYFEHRRLASFFGVNPRNIISFWLWRYRKKK